MAPRLAQIIYDIADRKRLTHFISLLLISEKQAGTLIMFPKVYRLGNYNLVPAHVLIFVLLLGNSFT